MMLEALKVIDKHLTDLGLNYEFGQMSKVSYPYWVGDYIRSDELTEDGEEDATFILDGFARGTFLELENQKELISDYFKHGVRELTKSNVFVNIAFSDSNNIPVEDDELKRCQIHLKIKLWKGI